MVKMICRALSLVAFTLLGLLVEGKQTKNSYTKDEVVQLKVTNMSPGGNPVSGRYYLYPLSYFDPTANFCYADKFSKDSDKFDNNKYQHESKVIEADPFFSDDILYGPRTIYSIFQQDHTCRQNCWRDYKTVNASYINFLIENDYRLNFYIDDLPVGKEYYDYNSNKFYMSNNVPIGFSDVNHVLHVYNHWQFVIYYTNNGLNDYHIVKTVMQQRSARRVKTHEEQCQVYPPQSLRLKPNVCNRVIFTFDYIWKEVNDEMTNHIDWNNRLEKYHHDLINSKIDVIQNILYIFLVIFVAVYSKSKIGTDSYSKKDYKPLTGSESPVKIESDSNDDMQDVEIIAINGDYDDMLTNWYSLKNDVFRKPKFLVLFSNMIGFGFQFVVIAFIVIVSLILQSISVITPNEVKRTIFVLVILTSPIQSFVSSTVYKNFHPSYLHNRADNSIIRQHKALFMLNSVFTPLVFFLVNSVLNSAYKSVGSVKYLNNEIMLRLFKKYVILYLPLSLSGTLLALMVSKNNLNSPSIKVNMIEKKIPSSNAPLLNKPWITSLVIAVFPFSVLCNRLTYLWTAILFNNLYFGYWNYLLTLVLASIISVLITNLMVFNNLNCGDWKWHWLTIQSGLNVGLYGFIYSFKFVEWFKFGNIQSALIFISQNFLINLLIGAGFASLNFVFAWNFIRKIYNANA